MAKVLIVEDEYAVAAGLQRILTEAGHQVVGLASRSQRALALAAREAPEIAIVDLNLAIAFDGIETARLLVERHGARIIIASAYTHAIVADAGAQVAACATLIKPFDRVDVLRAMRECAAA